MSRSPQIRGVELLGRDGGWPLTAIRRDQEGPCLVPSGVLRLQGAVESVLPESGH